MHSLRGAFEHAPHTGSSIDLQGSQNAWVTVRNKYVEAIKAGEHPLLHVGVVEVIYSKPGPHDRIAHETPRQRRARAVWSVVRVAEPPLVRRPDPPDLEDTARATRCP